MPQKPLPTPRGRGFAYSRPRVARAGGGVGMARATQPRPVPSVGRIVGTAPSRAQRRSSSRWQASRVLPRTMYTTSLMTISLPGLVDGRFGFRRIWVTNR
ncbi:hypothetical protein SGLAM104S_01618 [Streptomyces glaucescens]